MPVAVSAVPSVVPFAPIPNTITPNTPKAKGGMCANPCGVNECGDPYGRLDRIELFDFAGGSATGEQIIYLATIKDAANQFVNYGLGKNGTTADEFWMAVEYFFRLRASDPATWPMERTVKDTYRDDLTGKRKTIWRTISDHEMRWGCFDTHYDLAGLDQLMRFDVFVPGLQERRLQILSENWDQICAYLHIPADVAIEHKALHALVHPTEPEQVEWLLWLQRRTKATVPLRPMSQIATPVEELAVAA